LVGILHFVQDDKILGFEMTFMKGKPPPAWPQWYAKKGRERAVLLPLMPAVPGAQHAGESMQGAEKKAGPRWPCLEIALF
jgi:hypothetical protein